jgi:AcrR family transcriptional regulator
MEYGMNPSRIERKKEKTKQKIITVAIHLFKQHGFDATTMEQIAEEADIAKGTLYNYFPAKETIISEYVQRSFKDRNPDRILQFRTMPDTRSRLTLILSELMERVQAQQDIFETFLAYRIQQVVSLRPDPDESTKSDFDSLAVEIIELGQQSAEIRTDLPLDMLVDLFEFVFVEVAKQFYMQPDTFNAHAAIEQGVDLFMNGVQQRT